MTSEHMCLDEQTFVGDLLYEYSFDKKLVLDKTLKATKRQYEVGAATMRDLGFGISLSDEKACDSHECDPDVLAELVCFRLTAPPDDEKVTQKLISMSDYAIATYLKTNEKMPYSTLLAVKKESKKHLREAAKRAGYKMSMMGGPQPFIRVAQLIPLSKK
jgi:hypothetical protein